LKKKIFRIGLVVALIGITSLILDYTSLSGFEALSDLILLFTGGYLIRLSRFM
jgi:hypothetical protein